MLCRRVLHLYMKYPEYVIVYAVIVHQTNISCSSEVPYGRANRVSYISLLFHTPCTVPFNRVSYISLLFHTPCTVPLNRVSYVSLLFHTHCTVPLNRESYISLLFHTPCTVPLNRVSYISLLFHTPWIKLNEVIVYRVMMYANSLQIV